MAQPSEAQACGGCAAQKVWVDVDSGDGVLRCCIGVVLHPFPQNAFELIPNGIQVPKVPPLPLWRILPTYRMFAVMQNKGRQRNCCWQQDTGKQVVHSHKFRQGKVAESGQYAQRGDNPDKCSICFVENEGVALSRGIWFSARPSSYSLHNEHSGLRWR